MGIVRAAGRQIAAAGTVRGREDARAERVGGKAMHGTGVKIRNGRWIAEAVRQMADRIVKAGGLESAVLVGIRSRGPVLAARVASEIRSRTGAAVPVGALDITLYRDDFASRGPVAAKKGTDLDTNLDGRTVYLVDDVLNTGRTVRAAMDELVDFGRPKAIRLMVLIDRGGRELPIQPDFAAGRIEVGPDVDIRARVTELDGEDGVFEVPRAGGPRPR
ncbi:MAG: bifunctional pyr operon transcriptional regulator/uracil phosphoribosyltransferase PyrR [Planctomycetota bacterium]|nr:bifunctional pyr operon transcriptional regulator/uracil phosphoribosyltransferase PyrR [Planctomycetota bacterium]